MIKFFSSEYNKKAGEISQLVTILLTYIRNAVVERAQIR